MDNNQSRHRLENKRHFFGLPVAFAASLTTNFNCPKERMLMSLPKVAANSPQEVSLVAGEKYAYCTCGLSEKQPFCDGKHKGTDFKPLVFTAEETKSAWFCRCKQTCNAPNCDGSHNKLSQPTPSAAAIE